MTLHHRDTALLPVFQSISQALTEHRVDTLFGLMGDANLFLSDHFARQSGQRFVPATHEGNAVLMALAYAQVSGRPGVATVTHGPALTNCVTALTEGARGRIPMVLLVGDTPVGMPRHVQSIDQREVVKVTGAGFVQMRAPETAGRDVARAFYQAEAERRPVVLNMPADFMWVKTRHETVQHRVFRTPAFAPEGPELEDAIGILAAARRPMVLAGAGARAARTALIRLADRLEAPLATTLRAKGLFADHPYNMGICGTLSTDPAYEAIGNADCVVCFGASLHDFTTDRGKLFAGKRVVQIDTDPQAIGESLHPDVAMIADAGLTAENFVHWLDEAEVPPSGFTGELAEGLSEHEIDRHRAAAPGTVDFVPALERLEQALPRDRVLVTDGGRFMTEVWCRLSVPDPQSFVLTAHFGSIGLGLAEAIGAGYVDEYRPVVLFTGDGGFMMSGLTEFNTAVREKRDLIVILCNDAAYGAEHVQMVDRDMDPELTTFAWPSFAATATALGGLGLSVRSAEDLDQAINALATRDRPVLIEMHLDPHQVPRMRI